jgi:hypothetical protein
VARNLRVDARRLIVSLVIAAGLGLIVYGFSIAQTGTSSALLPVGVEQVVPANGDLVLRQSMVAADLAPGYRGVLVIDGQEIPTYDIGTGTIPSGAAFDAQFDPAQNTVSFTPKTGATIEKFSPGSHQASVIYWKMAESRDDAMTYSWQFKVS